MRRVFFLIIIFFIASLSLAEEVHPTTVVLKGEKVSPFLGTPVSSLALYRYEADNEGLFPVSLQVDQRDEEGRLIVGENTDEHPLRPDDELIFLLEDGGERLPDIALSFLDETLVEFEVCGRYFYLSASSRYRGDLPSIIETSSKGNFLSINALSYSAILAKDRFFLVKLAFPRGGNILDRSKIRVRARLKWWFFYILAIKPLVKTEADVLFETRGIRKGPLRVTVVGEPRLRVVGRDIPSGEVELSFYPEKIVFPIIVSSPITLARYCSSASFTTSLDFASSASGMKVYLPGGWYGVADGKMDFKERELGSIGSDFAAISGEDGVVIFFIKPGARAEKLPHSFYFVDDAGKHQPPEGEPGVFPEVGFQFDILQAKPGSYKLYQYLYFFPPEREISEKFINRLLQSPPDQGVKVRFLSP